MTSTHTHSLLKSWEHLKFWKYVWPDVYKTIEETKYFPTYNNLFKSLELTPYEKVKVVILGQDPYHTKGMAHGLAFSIQPHIKQLPPSLRNIFNEYCSDLGYPYPTTGDLTPWAERGVLLLNTILSVEEGKALSHKDIGWEKLAYEIIRDLDSGGRVVFNLWGKNAQEYRGAIENSSVVAVAHPSPLSKGFLGSKPFSRTNEYLSNKIDWRLP